MAGSIVTTGSKADRKPNWGKWRLMRRITVWQFVCLSMNIDPDNPPIEISDLVHPRRSGPPAPQFESYDRLAVREALLQGFKDKVQIVFSNLDEMVDSDTLLAKGTRRSWLNTVLDLQKAAAFVARTRWDAPPELLAMADEHLAKRTDGPRSGKRTDAANAKREAGKADRLEDLNRYIEDICSALDKAGHEIREIDGRKQLPVSAGDLHTLFLVRHPEHKSSRATFDDDLGKISTVKPGPKRYEVKDLAETLAGKISD
jgi:hypothetical protein